MLGKNAAEKTRMTCYILTSGCAGPCKCGASLEGDAHVVSHQVAVELVCRACCKVCTPLFTEFAGKAETVSGEQEVLF